MSYSLPKHNEEASGKDPHLFMFSCFAPNMEEFTLFGPQTFCLLSSLDRI